MTAALLFPLSAGFPPSDFVEMGDPKDAASPEAAPLDKPAESGILGALYSSAPIQPEPLHKNEDIEGIGQLHSIQSELMAADPTGFTDEDGIRRTGE